MVGSSYKKLKEFLESRGAKLIKYEGYYGENVVECGRCGEEFTCQNKPLWKNGGLCTSCFRHHNKGDDMTCPEKYRQVLTNSGSSIINYKNEKNINIFCGCCKRSHIRVNKNTLLKLGLCGMCTFKDNPNKIKRMKDRLAELGVMDATPISADDFSVYALGGIEFPCINCGETTSYTSDQTINTWTGCCPTCRSGLYTQTEAANKFSDHGFKLVGKYTGRHSPVEVVCPCGEPAKMRLGDVMSGKKCKNCKSNRTRTTVMEKYGVDNVSKDPEIRMKISKNIKDAIKTNPDILIARKNTNMERYGVVAAFLLPEHNEKKEKALLEKYGTLYPLKLKSIQEKVDATNMELYGVRRPLQDKDILDRAITGSIFHNMEVYGVPFAFMNKEFLEKALKLSGQIRAFVWPDESVHFVQGYEKFFMKSLVKKGVNPKDVTTGKEVVTIPYLDKTTKRLYFPDICVKTKKGFHLFEIKSVWSFLKCSELNYKKWIAATDYCDANDGTFHVIFYNGTGKLLLHQKGWRDDYNLHITGESVKFVSSVELVED